MSDKIAETGMEFAKEEIDTLLSEVSDAALFIKEKLNACKAAMGRMERYGKVHPDGYSEHLYLDKIKLALEGRHPKKETNVI